MSSRGSRQEHERFGAALRLLRTSSGWGLRALSRELGVSAAYLSRVEAGLEPPPSAERLVEIAAAIGVSPDTLGELAGRVAPDLIAFLHDRPMALRLLRTLREVDPPDELLADLVRRVRLDGAGGEPLRGLLERLLVVPAWRGDPVAGVAHALVRLGVEPAGAAEALRARGLTTDATASERVALAHVEARELDGSAVAVVRCPDGRGPRLVLALAYPPDAATRRAAGLGALARVACDRTAIAALEAAPDRALPAVCRRELSRVLGIVPPSGRRPSAGPPRRRRPA